MQDFTLTAVLSIAASGAAARRNGRQRLPVIAGGSTGPVRRHLAAMPGIAPSGTGFPWTTLATNPAGSSGIGALAAFGFDGHARRLAIAGVLGGFTTISAFLRGTAQRREGLPALARPCRSQPRPRPRRLRPRLLGGRPPGPAPIGQDARRGTGARRSARRGRTGAKAPGRMRAWLRPAGPAPILSADGDGVPRNRP